MSKEAPRIPPFFCVRRMRATKISKPGKFKRHFTRESAETEAKRLAALYPGWQFVVFEAVSSFQEAQPAPAKAAA